MTAIYGGDNNYATATSAAQSLTVNKYALTVSAISQSKIHNDGDPNFTYQITSGTLVGSDTLTGTPTRTSGEDDGAYDITQGSVSASNDYTLTFVNGTLTIKTLAGGSGSGGGGGGGGGGGRSSYTPPISSPSVTSPPPSGGTVNAHQETLVQRIGRRLAHAPDAVIERFSRTLARRLHTDAATIKGLLMSGR